MDEAVEQPTEENQLDRIKFAETKRVTEPVNGTIRVTEAKAGQRHLIYVGNTGLQIAIDHSAAEPARISGDYMPEHRLVHVPESQLRYTTLFFYALSKLTKWGQESPMARELGLLDEEAQLESLCQPELAELLEKTLEKYGHAEDIRTEEREEKKLIQLKLGALIAMKDGDPFKQFLGKMEKRGSRLSVTYDKTI